MKFCSSLLAGLLLLIMSSLESKGDTIEVSGLVSGVWNADTVKVIGNISLRESETLTIASGVKVFFHGPWYFEVNGSLKALGAADHPVVFTVSDTTGFSNDTIPTGGWNHIRIENINPAVDSIIFDYCHFSYGKAVSADSLYGYGGALCIRNAAQVAVRNSVFFSNYAFYNGGAVYLENASVDILNNHFESNRCGKDFAFYGYGGALCSFNGEPVIKGNVFYNNSSGSLGGGLCVMAKDGMISHNIFDENSSLLGGGFAIVNVQTPQFAIHNNLFIHNSAAYFGSAISNNNSSPLYVNNTIVDNHGQGGGGGFYCKDSVVPVLYNNIIYGNTHFGGLPNQVYLWDLLAQPNFYYNNIEGGKENFYGSGGTAFSGAYENNIDADPQFGESNYTPLPSSPMVNAGAPEVAGLFVPPYDLDGNVRVVDQKIDMGALENQIPVGVFQLLPVDRVFEFEVYPNPAANDVWFGFKSEAAQEISISAIGLDGVLIENIYDGIAGAGNHTIHWKIKNPALAHGACFIIFKTGSETSRKLLIVSR
jgi:hypothetical protein